MKRVGHFLAAAVAMAALAAGACAKKPRAAKGAMTPRDVFIAIDRNGDGKMSHAEYMSVWKDQARGEHNFSILDRDRSGFITRDEFPGAYPTSRK